MTDTETSVAIFIDYGKKQISEKIDERIFNAEEIYDVSKIVESSDAFSFIEKDFGREVDIAAGLQVEAIKKDLVRESGEALAKQKLELSMKYSEMAGSLINNIKTLLVNEFSITDIPVIESIVEKSAKQLDDEVLDKVFVSEATYKKVKDKVGDPIISVLGKRSPIGIGYGLSDQQIMLEGGRTVIVSDLDVIIDGYIPSSKSG